MIAALTLIAEIIGFVVLGLVFLLALVMAVSAVHYRIPKIDLYLYDENARWDARWRRRQKREGANSEPRPDASGDR